MTDSKSQTHSTVSNDHAGPHPHPPAKRISIAMIILFVTLAGGLLLVMVGAADGALNMNFVIWGAAALLFLIVGLFVIGRGKRISGG